MAGTYYARARARKRRFWWLVGAAGAFVRGRRIPDPEEDPGICAQAQARQVHHHQSLPTGY